MAPMTITTDTGSTGRLAGPRFVVRSLGVGALLLTVGLGAAPAASAQASRQTGLPLTIAVFPGYPT